MLHRSDLYRDCDSDRVPLRLRIGPWVFDFDIYRDQAGGSRPVRAGQPDSLLRDCFAITASDFAEAELAMLRSAVATSGDAVAASLFPQLAWLQPFEK